MRELSAAKLLTEGVHPMEEQSMTKAEKRSEWLTDKYILCLLALFPLFTGFHGYANLTAAKFWLYTGATAAWLLGLLPCLCTGARLFAKKPGAFFYLTCAFLVWNLVSAALSPWREKTFLGAGRYDGLFTQFLYALTALGIARWGRKKIIYVRVFGASVFLCCAVALWQIAGGNPLGLYPNGWRFADAGTLYSGMYLGTVGNTLILGSVLSLAVPVLVYTAVKKRGYDLLLLLPAAMALYILYRSECSSAWVALLGSCALMLPKLTRGRRRRYILAAEGALALTVLLAVYFYPGQSGTLYEASRLLHGEADASFGSHRVEIWREVCALIAQRPVFGGGPGTAAARLHIEFTRFVPETGRTLGTYVTNAHNEYLGYAMNLGWPGLVLYLGMVGVTFFRPRENGESAAWLWGAAAYWMQAFFALGLVVSAPLLWLAWGLVPAPEERSGGHEHCSGKDYA